MVSSSEDEGVATGTGACNGKPSKQAKKKRRRRSSGSPSSSELESTETATSNWSLLAKFWPVRERPDSLQRPEVVNMLDFTTLLSMAKFQKETKIGATSHGSKSAFSKDALPSSTLFKEAKDDGVRKLHEARFLRLPLVDHKKWWHLVPLSRSHMYRNIPLKFMGCQGQVAEKTVENAHDRSVAAQLKHYFSANISINTKPLKKIERTEEDGLSTVMDFLWEEPSTMSHVQDAVINYQAVLHHLWPTDPTAIILMKVLTKYKWIQAGDSLKDKVTTCTSFFNSVMRENAGRAVRGETVMNFEEQERLLKDVLVANGISGTVPVGRIPKVETKPVKKFADTKPGPSQPKKGPRGFARVGGLGCCYGFNDGVCTNVVKTKAGCKDAKGREFAHNCNKVNTQTGIHCLGEHSRQKHLG